MIPFDDVYPRVRRHTLLNEAKCSALWDVASSLGGVAGDAAELGVYLGGVGRLLATACPNRTVRLFDTFTGIPATDPAIDWHKPGEFAVGLYEVRAYLSDCPNVMYHPGLFPDSAVGERFAVVHLDADLYSSTKSGLEWFWPRLSAGGAVVLDDWNWKYCPGVNRAVDEFFAKNGGYLFIETAPHQLTVKKCS